MNKDILGTGFSPCYWPCNPWGEFSPWYCYLVHKRCWFFSVARYYYVSSNFFAQSLTLTPAVLAGTKQLFMRDHNGPLRFREYYTFSISYPVPELFHFAVPDSTRLRIIHQLNRWIPYKLMKFRILTSASRMMWCSMGKLLERINMNTKPLKHIWKWNHDSQVISLAAIAFFRHRHVFNDNLFKIS